MGTQMETNISTLSVLGRHTGLKIADTITHWNTDVQRPRYTLLHLSYQHPEPHIFRIGTQMSTDRQIPSRTTQTRARQEH